MSEEQSPKNFDHSETSLTLLSALKDDVRQHEAWHRFVQRYGPRIEGWCRRWGLQDADARDVTQNVLLQLARQMRSFEYDSSGRFRAWLKTIAWRAWADYLSARSKNMALPSSVEMLGRLDTVEARDDLMARLDDEANRELLEVAVSRVKKRVKETTFEAFRLMAFEGKSGLETANELGMSPSSVFASKSRIDKMLSEEVALLDRD
ncbi:MAG: sigma-70 family RNA polymerase sigma factor [Planctomycetota bacterium]